MGPIEEGGCPFTHFDDENLGRILKVVLPNDKEDVEVLINQRKKDPNISCKLLFNKIYKNVRHAEPKDCKIQNPVQFYLLLKKDIK